MRRGAVPLHTTLWVLGLGHSPCPTLLLPAVGCALGCPGWSDIVGGPHPPPGVALSPPPRPAAGHAVRHELLPDPVQAELLPVPQAPLRLVRGSGRRRPPDRGPRCSGALSLFFHQYYFCCGMQGSNIFSNICTNIVFVAEWKVPHTRLFLSTQTFFETQTQTPSRRSVERTRVLFMNPSAVWLRAFLLSL